MGRGRNGNKWQSHASGLYCSLKINNPIKNKDFLPIKVGIACHRAISELGYKNILLKWPNDILQADLRKVGGILLESRAEETVVGIGINTKKVNAQYGFLDGLKSEFLLAEAILRKFEETFEQSTQELVFYWEQHSLYQKGRWVTAKLPDGKIIKGQVSHITESGELIILNEKQSFALHSAEISSVRQFYMND
jgi:BirA family transcriptional regulator, biotin operon repressor / biotin---[acetyl-CoA-carboxylase] ligase